MKKTLQKMSMALAVPFILAACGGSDNSAEAPAQREAAEATTTTVQADEPKIGGTLFLGAVGDPVLFNDHYSTDVPSSNVAGMINVGLTGSNEKLEIIPVVAKGDAMISEDGLEWTFEMHENVRFHDGQPLTAHDVVFTYMLFKDPDYTGPRAGSFSSLDRVEAIDDYTVRFYLTEPDARFATLTGYNILPKHILGEVPVAELGEYNAFNIDNPIGAGPFKFVEWEQGVSLTLEANEDYFEGRPYVDRIIFRHSADLNANVVLLGTGEIHHFAGIPPGELPVVEAYDNVRVSETLALRYDFLSYNLRRPLFQDKRVRQALTHAIDRELIVETVMEGRATVAHAPASPLSWAYNDNVPQFNFDLDKSRALLAEAGWTPGPDGILVNEAGDRFSFEILSNDGNTVRRDLAIIVQQMLKEVGIEVTARQLEWGAFLDMILAPNFDFDAAILAWGLALDPDPSAIWHSREIEAGLNNIGYSNPEVDALADSNIRIVDQAERAAELAKIWAIIAEDQPYTFMWYPQQYVGLNNAVKGFVHHPRADYYDIHRWWIDQ